METYRKSKKERQPDSATCLDKDAIQVEFDRCPAFINLHRSLRNAWGSVLKGK